MSDVFTVEEKRIIAGRARTLQERLEDPDSLEYREQADSGEMELLEAWRQVFPDDEAFTHRLEHAGVTMENCRRAVRAGRLAANEPIPPWIDRLEDLIVTVHDCSPGAPADVPGVSRNFADDCQPAERPFGEFIAAIAASTFSRLSSDEVGHTFDESAMQALFQWLCDRFEERFWRILFVEFKANVKAADPGLASAELEEFDTLPTAYYDGFLDYLFSGGFGDLCREYPMFSRLLATQTGLCEQQLREFCTRLQADRERIASRFDVDGSLGDVVGLEPLATDTFGSSRAVMCVQFESGLAVTYKPRSVTAEAAFYRSLDKLDSYLPTADFDTPTYLPRENYGWVEWVEYEASRDKEAVGQYYRQAGVLICVAYFLGLVDCTVDNLVASGDQPVLVDVEAVLQPRVKEEPVQTGDGGENTVRETVLETGLLPTSEMGFGGESDATGVGAKMAGLGISSEEAMLEEITWPTIKGANSDVMAVERRPVSVDRTENVPTLDGVDQAPDAYRGQLLDGFEKAYETILALRDDGRLFDEIELLESFESVETRFLYRGWYSRLIKSLTAADSLHDGIRFGIAMEPLIFPLCSSEVDDSRPWSIYDAERAALKRLEKPRFTCPADGLRVKLDGRAIGIHADQSGLQRCRERIQSATREDLETQLETIQKSLDCLPT